MSELINKLNQYRSMGDKFYPEDILVIEDVWELLDEIERLNNIINEITKTIKDDYFKASDYVRKIEQSGKPQGDYPVYYYYNLKKQELTDEYLSKLQELKGSDKE